MFGTIMNALNAAYDAQEGRPWWKQKLIAIGATFGAVLIIGLAVLLMLGGSSVIATMTTAMGMGGIATVLWTIVQYALALALLVGAIWGMYVLLPDIPHQSDKQALVGAVFAGVLWIIFTVVFRLYVSHFGAYNRTYGVIGTVLVLLTWMYWSMFAILAGGELNAELRAGTGSSAVKNRYSTVPNRISTHQGVPNASSEVR